MGNAGVDCKTSFNTFIKMKPPEQQVRSDVQKVCKKHPNMSKYAFLWLVATSNWVVKGTWVCNGLPALSSSSAGEREGTIHSPWRWRLWPRRRCFRPQCWAGNHHILCSGMFNTFSFLTAKVSICSYVTIQVNKLRIHDIGHIQHSLILIQINIGYTTTSSLSSTNGKNHR